MHRLSVMFLALLLVPTALGAQASVAQAKARERIIAAVPEDAPPTYFRDRRSGDASGFAVEVMAAVAKREGFDVQFLLLKDWTEIIAALKDGRADVAPGMGISAERKKLLDFTEPIDAFPISFFIRSGDHERHLRDKKAEIGVLAGSVAGERLALWGYSRLVPYQTFGQGLFDLLAGRIVAFACPAPTLLQLARDSGVEDRIRIHGEPIAEIQRAIAVRKEDALLRERLDRAISVFVKSPEYREIFVKWYGKPAPFWTIRTIMLAAGSSLAVVVVAFLAWHYRRVLVLNRKLENALNQVTMLSGLLPICTACKKIRDAAGSWNSIEAYISERSNAEFSHGICPDCAQKLYPQFYKPSSLPPEGRSKS